MDVAKEGKRNGTSTPDQWKEQKETETDCFEWTYYYVGARPTTGETGN